MRVLLRDMNQAVVDAWTQEFRDHADVEVSRGDIFDLWADAIVSPANSFGFMTGGIDAAYSQFFGPHLQERLQQVIADSCYGELPVGQALVVPTGHRLIPYLVSSPTMRVPEDVSHQVNAYLAFRAALIAVGQLNEREEGKVKSLLCPGMGTLTGRIRPDACARQMRIAYERIVLDGGEMPQDLFHAMREHVLMLGKS
jgi:O-acetyl-ADP-ribose deacetylase (regulator of RNase III)